MSLSTNQILYISAVSCLFVIFNIMIVMKDKIESFSIIMLFLSLIVFIVLGTLSTIKKN